MENINKIASRELRMLKRLQHHNIVSLIEAITFDNRLYLIFEYIDMNLLEYLKRYPKGMNITVAMKLIYQLCGGVRYCHENEVIGYIGYT